MVLYGEIELKRQYFEYLMLHRATEGGTEIARFFLRKNPENSTDEESGDPIFGQSLEGRITIASAVV